MTSPSSGIASRFSGQAFISSHQDFISCKMAFTVAFIYAWPVFISSFLSSLLASVFLDLSPAWLSSFWERLSFLLGSYFFFHFSPHLGQQKFHYLFHQLLHFCGMMLQLHSAIFNPIIHQSNPTYDTSCHVIECDYRWVLYWWSDLLNTYRT
jgi:hypothetical protein